MKRKLTIPILLILMWASTASAAFQEPIMSDYTTYPIFTAQSVPPNIMIILDNSGSMNFNAYGTYPGDSKTVTDSPYEGEPYNSVRVFPLISGADDLEERTAPSSTPLDNGDLDFGGFNASGTDALMALRFQNLEIPQGATIKSAYIEFMAITSTDAATYPTNLLIEGVASDDAPVLALSADYIKDLTPTNATVAWNAVESWLAGRTYRTADISPVLQEIVTRPGWAEGNAAAFRFSGNGFREAYSFNGGHAPVLRVTFDNAVPKRYYGLFNPDYFYTYTSGVFTPAYKKVNYNSGAARWNVETLAGGATTLDDTAIVSQKLWDGNFANWVSMRRIDVLRMVLMGGKGTSRTGGGNNEVQGEKPAQASRIFKKVMDTSGTGPAVTPYDGNYTYTIDGGYIYIGTAKYSIDVLKDPNIEPEFFYQGLRAGVLQRVGDKARWGNIWFNDGATYSGGTVEHVIGTNMTTMVTDLQNTGCDTNTPLAEAYYVAMQYFKQEKPEGGLGYPNSAVPCSNINDDPYHNKDTGEDIYCAKSFVILLTDGASTRDAKIPSQYKDTDGDGDKVSCNESTSANCDYADGGTDFLDDVALYARTNDLRSTLEGNQNMILYAIYAFGNDDNARKLLRDAARNGGFEDRNGNGKPDGDYTDPANDRLEWDKDSDGIPDTYFEANDGYALQARLLQAITDILRRASSGTAASVLATNAEGAGNSVQAYFRPVVTSGLTEARWLGYLQSLWIDPWGNLREDSNANHVLDLKRSSSGNAAGNAVDKIITFVSDNTDTHVLRYTKHYLYNPDNGDNDTCAVSDCSVETEEVGMESISPIFEAGKLLSQRDPVNRAIFTYLDNNKNKIVDSNEVVKFDNSAAGSIKPYLGVASNTTWSSLGNTQDKRVTNLINWVRGTDQEGLRNRTLDGVTWRLGDIVHSTPIVVGRPSELFHQMYGDASYADFMEYAAHRETVVYVGANDGMLHAFTDWEYKTDSQNNPSYVKPAGAGASEKLGDELWAYIPGSLLPHLKWTASTDYTHTYYVDSEVRVFDAKILPDDTYYSDSDTDPNYGTFLVTGLNMGGKAIQVNEDFGSGTPEVRSFAPTYTMIDVTEPRNPKVMWERSYANLGMSRSMPAPVRVGNQWFLVFGSGPTDYDGSSTHGSYIFVVDMKTGAPYNLSAGNDWMWGPFGSNANFNDPLALDLFQSANVDAIFMANNFYSGNQWQSTIYKITIPCSKCEWDGYKDQELVYSSNPANWNYSSFFTSDRPVSVKLNSAADPLYNIMLFFGTGRYLSDSDKTDTSPQYLYGIRDPFYNREKYDGKNGNYYHNFSQTLTLTRPDLFAAAGMVATTDGHVSGSPYGDANFQDFVIDMRTKTDGWYLPLLTNSNSPSERIISQSSILGGSVLTPTYTPNSDICGMGGDTALLGVYYETGTGYMCQLFNIANKRFANVTVDGNTNSEEVVEIRDDNLLRGTPAPKLIFHAGMESGANALLQQGSGATINISVQPALYFKSMVVEWWDNENTPD